MLGWAFMGGLIAPALAIIPWLSGKLNGPRAAGLGASLLGLWFGGLYIHLSKLAWLGDTRGLFALTATPGILAGLSGLTATFVPGLPALARRGLYAAAGLLLLPLLPAMKIFPPGIVLTLAAVFVFLALALVSNRSDTRRS